MRAAALYLLTLGLIAAASGEAIAQAQDTITPADQVYAQARHTWLTQQYAPYLDYDVAVTVTDGGVVKTERYTSAYDATNNVVWVDPVSDWETAHPAIVKGINLGFFGLPINKPMAPEDWLNVPMLAPTYAFAIAPWVAMPAPHKPTPEELVAAVRLQFHDPNPRVTPSASPVPDSGLKVIADVSAVKRHYDITLVGDDTIDGHDCYHLAMHPLADAHTYRLRDLWIGRADYRTWQLNEAYNFKAAPGTDVPWTVTFADIGGAQYVAQEHADAPISTNGLIYTQASIAFESIRARATPVAPLQFPPAHLLTEP